MLFCYKERNSEIRDMTAIKSITAIRDIIAMRDAIAIWDTTLKSSALY